MPLRHIHSPDGLDEPQHVARCSSSRCVGVGRLGSSTKTGLGEWRNYGGFSLF